MTNHINMKTKKRILKAYIISVVNIYGSEAWTIDKYSAAERGCRGGKLPQDLKI